MRTAEKYYLPTVVGDNNGNDVENPKATTATTGMQSTTKVQWCWKETPYVMDRHDAEVIVGDPADCWIKYDEDSNAKLEVAFQGGHGECSPMPGYVVSFIAMTQTKSATCFQRDVQRLVEDADGQQDNGAKQLLGLDDAQVGGTLPFDIRKEPQMVLVKGDVVQIQISKQRPDGWAFGTKVLILSLSPLIAHIFLFFSNLLTLVTLYSSIMLMKRLLEIWWLTFPNKLLQKTKPMCLQIRVGSS
jgi:hypothetical protein